MRAQRAINGETGEFRTVIMSGVSFGKQVNEVNEVNHVGLNALRMYVSKEVSQLENVLNDKNKKSKEKKRAFTQLKNIAGLKKDEYAMMSYGNFLWEGGDVIESDKKLALEVFHKLATKNNLNPDFERMMKLFYADKCRAMGDKKYEEVAPLLEKYIELEDSEALMIKAAFFQQSNPDLEKELLERAVKKGSNHAKLLLGAKYIHSNSEEEKIKGFEYFTQCESVSAYAKRVVGNCYEYGLGTAIDLPMACQKYLEAANQGDFLSRLPAAFLLSQGLHGVTCDKPKALEILKSMRKGIQVFEGRMKERFYALYIRLTVEVFGKNFFLDKRNVTGLLSELGDYPQSDFYCVMGFLIEICIDRSGFCMTADECYRIAAKKGSIKAKIYLCQDDLNIPSNLISDYLDLVSSPSYDKQDVDGKVEFIIGDYYSQFQKWKEALTHYTKAAQLHYAAAERKMKETLAKMRNKVNPVEQLPIQVIPHSEPERNEGSDEGPTIPPLSNEEHPEEVEQNEKVNSKETAVAKVLGKKVDSEELLQLAREKETNKEYAGAVALYKAAIEAGNSEACFWIGSYFEDNIGGEKDIGMAIFYYLLGIAKADPRSMNRYGLLVQQESPNQAFELFEIASSMEDFEAKNQLGICYMEGMGCRKDEEKAKFYWNEAYEAHVPEAAFNLGRLSEINRKYNEALFYYEVGAGQGHNKSSSNLSFLQARLNPIPRRRPKKN